jgi:hypothetical protein
MPYLPIVNSFGQQTGEMVYIIISLLDAVKFDLID